MSIAAVTLLTALPNYFDMFGTHSDLGTHYRSDPGSTNTAFLSSVGHSGGLLNVVGNIGACTYVYCFATYLQRFRVFNPLVNVGRYCFSNYIVYVIVAAAFLGGYPGFSAAFSVAQPAPYGGTLDWATFSSWVNQSSSWADLKQFERQFSGPSSTNLLEALNAHAATEPGRWAFPIVAGLMLVVSTFVARFSRWGICEILIYRHQQLRASLPWGPKPLEG